MLVGESSTFIPDFRIRVFFAGGVFVAGRVGIRAALEIVLSVRGPVFLNRVSLPGGVLDSEVDFLEHELPHVLVLRRVHRLPARLPMPVARVSPFPEDPLPDQTVPRVGGARHDGALLLPEFFPPIITPFLHQGDVDPIPGPLDLRAGLEEIPEHTREIEVSIGQIFSIRAVPMDAFEPLGVIV